MQGDQLRLIRHQRSVKPICHHGFRAANRCLNCRLPIHGNNLARAQRLRAFCRYYCADRSALFSRARRGNGTGLNGFADDGGLHFVRWLTLNPVQIRKPRPAVSGAAFKGVKERF